MTDTFFSAPILNSPYHVPTRHWELDEFGQPTGRIAENRRKADFITPIPKAKKQKKGQKEMVLDEGKGLSSEAQQYTRAIINDLRLQVERWRAIKDPAQWRVTPETSRLLQHWRRDVLDGFRPFFCQVEAIETVIWLTEVAPEIGKEGKKFLEYLEGANREANPELLRLALKLATGAGKTTVMAMLIAWQTINHARRPQSKRFTNGFLVVSPGITIKDRLRVLLPNDLDNYYETLGLIPHDMLGELKKAKVVITNYHAFKLRETLELSKGGRLLLQGPRGAPLQTTESPGQMLQR
ncbi:MAG: DEAD/DEAH box helicase family protein, partial [Gemmatimonadales bacterium]